MTLAALEQQEKEPYEPKTVFEDVKTWSIEQMATFISEIDHTIDYEDGDYDPAIMAWLSSEKKEEI